jgi:hypothetical protein
MLFALYVWQAVEHGAGGGGRGRGAVRGHRLAVLLRHEAPPHLPAPGSRPAPRERAVRSSRPTSSPGEKPLVPCVYLLPTLSFRIRCLGPEMGALVVMVRSIQNAD